MDPITTMELIIDATDLGHEVERQKHIDDLTAWLASGGFAPPMHARCAFPASPVCTAKWDNHSWLRWWLSSGAHVARGEK